MRTIGFFIYFIAVSISATDAQIFGQQASKRKIMIQQIIQLSLLGNSIKSGEHTADTGLRSGQAKKDGTYMLHHAYVTSLFEVSPAFQNDPRIERIREYRNKDRGVWERELSWQRTANLLTQKEIRHLQAVADNIGKEDDRDVEELDNVLRPGKMQLKDKERLDRIEAIHRRMADKYAFTMSYTGKCRKLVLARRSQRAQKQQIRKLYGIQ